MPRPRPIDDPEDREILVRSLAQKILAAGRDAEQARTLVSLVESPDSVEENLAAWRKALARIEALQDTFQDLTGQYPSQAAVHKAAQRTV